MRAENGPSADPEVWRDHGRRAGQALSPQGRPRPRVRQSEPRRKAGTPQAREVGLGTKIMALPDRRYGVIYADPEWHFEPYPRMTG
jgi:hypothetical protein